MKFAKSAALIVVMVLASSALASAQEPATGSAGAAAGVSAAQPLARFNGIGVGLVIIGAGLGIGRLAAAAVESMARQPELAATIQAAMIISAALIEGVAFFAIIVLSFIISGS